MIGGGLFSGSFSTLIAGWCVLSISRRTVDNSLNVIQSLSLGRPPSISLAHVDARRPDYEGQGLSVSRQEVLCASN